MASLNENFLKISKKYLFSLIEARRDALKSLYPEEEFVDLGVGDVTLPLSSSIAEGLKKGAEEMTQKVYGYGPYEGYHFLREALKTTFFSHCPIRSEEIFISDGITSDLCGLQELFSNESKVAIIDPAYPLYETLSTLANREIIKLPLTAETHYMPEPPETAVDIIYLTSPGNPTGVALTRDCLKKWVAYAKKHDSILFFDAAYSGFIRSKDVPLSIYEIEGAQDVAIELSSFSKTFGFTGIRLGYCIIPKALSLKDALGKKHSLHSLWLSRQSSKTNGISFPVQKAGLAALSPKGLAESRAQIETYLSGAQKIKSYLTSLGYDVIGGMDSPYLWWKIPSKNSWEWFEYLIDTCRVISIPGAGFGQYGEGYIRLSGFVNDKKASQAIRLLSNLKEVAHAS